MEWVVEFLSLLVQTIELRAYVFLFLTVSLLFSSRLLGWKRTSALFLITWITAFICEFSSTRIGIPFGYYYYTGSTSGQELYLSNIPFMDSLSFAFLLYASYSMALVFVLPAHSSESRRGWVWQSQTCTSWPVVLLATMFFAFIDVVIDPVALRGQRWFLGQIYGYPEPGVYFGVPLANFIGWAIVGWLSLILYRMADRTRWMDAPPLKNVVNGELLGGVGLYYGVLLFNLAVTFWIGESLIGMVGCFIYLPISIFLFLRLTRCLTSLAGN